MYHVLLRVVLHNGSKNLFFKRSVSTARVKLNSLVINQNMSKHMIFLHGLLGSGSNWRSIATNISKSNNLSCHLLDARNHGASPHTKTIGYAQMADDTMLYLQESNINLPIIVLGHSMGGKTAMNMAIRFPHAIERLVVVDILPISYGEQNYKSLSKIFQAIKQVDLGTITDRKHADATLKKYIPEDVIRSFVLQSLKRNDTGARNLYSWKFNLDVLSSSLSDWIDAQVVDGTFSNPSLFVFGEKSQYYNKQHLSAIKNAFPNSSIEVVPNATHYVHYEKQQEFMDILRNFLKN